MNSILSAWNKADEEAALDAMLACCGARRWAAAMVALRPIPNIIDLSAAADRSLEHDGRGRLDGSIRRSSAHWRAQGSACVKKSTTWSNRTVIGEECGCGRIEGPCRRNLLYEQRFGFTYVVCATGKSAEESLQSSIAAWAAIARLNCESS